MGIDSFVEGATHQALSKPAAAACCVDYYIFDVSTRFHEEV
jgi:hypothetical protein